MAGGLEVGQERVRETWYEHKMPDGRVYFSHSVSRKTTWDRPQNAQIKPHPAQQSRSPLSFSVESNLLCFLCSDTAPAHSFGPTPPGMPNASHLMPTRVWSDFHTPDGKPYFYNKITRISVWEKPTDFDLVMPLPPELGAPPAVHQQQRMPLPRPAHSPGPRLPLMSTPPMFPPRQAPFGPGFPLGPPPPMMNPPRMEPRFLPPPPASHLLNTPPSPATEGGGRPDSNGNTGEPPQIMEVDKDKEAPAHSVSYP